MTQNRSYCSLLDASRIGSDWSNRLLRGAFDVKDLQTQDTLNFQNLLNGVNFKLKANTYALEAVSILKQLTQDIYVSIDLFKYGDWDTFILQDALKLLQYTLDNLFGGGDNQSGRAKGLGVAYKVCRDNPNYGQVASDFCEARKEAIVAFGNLRIHLEDRGHLPDSPTRKNLLDDFTKVSPNDKISTATFLELMVRNEARKKVRTSTQYENTATEFRNIVQRFHDSYEKISRDRKGSLTDCTWHPATIVIVRDKASGLVFTGATKAKGVGIPVLEGIAYKITVMRLGNEFRGKINRCNEAFESRIGVNDTTHLSPPSSFNELQNSRTDIRKDLPEISIFQDSTNPATSLSSSVVSLALNTRPCLVKNPCTRCQSFYHAWNLMRQDEFDGWELHRRELAGRELTRWKLNQWKLFQKEKPWDQFKNLSYGFNYCAETVAAAQLVSLHTGSVISNVQE